MQLGLRHTPVDNRQTDTPIGVYVPLVVGRLAGHRTRFTGLCQPTELVQFVTYFILYVGYSRAAETVTERTCSEQ